MVKQETTIQQKIPLATAPTAALNALLRDLKDGGTLRNEGENAWTVFDVVGHLIHGERTDWMQRAATIVQFGESRAFEPFDREGQVRESQGKSLAQLLDEFARLRSENLVKLRAMNLRQEDLMLLGPHPSPRAGTLSGLLATWA